MIDDSWQEKTISFFQRLLPFMVAVLMVLLNYLPAYIDVFNNIRPDFGLMAVYFWMLYRPDLFGLYSVAILGLLDGAISSAALGLDLFAYLLMYVLIVPLRNILIGRSFVVIWCAFVAISFGVLLVKWLLATIYFGKILPILALMLTILLGAAVYPVVSMMLAFIKKWFLQDDEL